MTTSGDSAKESQQIAARLRQQILDLARKAQNRGLTINEAERLINNHKGHSISPRFAELVRRGLLIRILIGRTRPTKRSPHGAPRYVTRFDPETRRNVNVHWVPEFAPSLTMSQPEKRHLPDCPMKALSPIHQIRVLDPPVNRYQRGDRKAVKPASRQQMCKSAKSTTR